MPCPIELFLVMFFLPETVLLPSHDADTQVMTHWKCMKLTNQYQVFSVFVQ